MDPGGHEFQGRFNEFLDWDRVASDAPEVGYDDSHEGLVRGDAGSIDVHASVEATEPFPVERALSRLELGAKY